MIERVRQIKSRRGRDKTNDVLNCFTERYYFYLMNGQTFYSHFVKKQTKHLFASKYSHADAYLVA